MAFLDWFARIGSILVAGIGAAVLVGWVADLTVLKSVVPGLATMKVNAALAFLAAGVSLLLVASSVPGSPWMRIGRVLGCAVAVVGGLSLAEYLSRGGFGIDQILVPHAMRAAAGQYPDRMAPASAFNFICIGCAIAALRAAHPRLSALVQWFAVPPFFVATLAIVGYAYGVGSLYRVGSFTTMAVHTAFGFFVLTLSILAADSRHGVARLATSGTAGSIVIRRLLSTIPLALFAIGWAALVGQRAGLYESNFGLALMVVVTLTVSVLAVSATAFTLDRVDSVRRRAEAEVIALNAGLEGRVQERTKELSQLSVDLNAANASLEALSLQDGLTHLANRRFFDAYLVDQINVARRHKRPLALILFDVDAFKAYNDHYGHPGGDAVLRVVGAALQSCCRRPTDMAARYGGEEFAMVLPDTGLGAAVSIGELARDAVARLRLPHGASAVGPCVSVSAGVAISSGIHDMTPEQLVALADQALYRAKRLGRNRVEFAHDEAGQNVVRGAPAVATG